MNVIATLPLRVNFKKQIVDSIAIDEIRINTINPLAKPPKETLEQVMALCPDKKIWIDLKCRQLRIDQFSHVPSDFVLLNHKIKVPTPTPIHFDDHNVGEIASIVDGNKLILAYSPHKIVGKGQPVNILNPNLEIEGFFVPTDLEYIQAAKELGIHNYLLSFVEKGEDIDALLALDPEANIIAKIESKRGLDFVVKEYVRYNQQVKLMAARDDLYINMGNNKEDIINALRLIIQMDCGAIVASKILTSFTKSSVPDIHDMTDLEWLRSIGYRNMMLCDNVCEEYECFQRASDFIIKHIKNIRS